MPPSLNTWGLSTKFTIVDSTPILHSPPSNTKLIFFPNSSVTSFFETGLIFVEIFALGAARGYFNLFKRFLVKGCLGNLTAKVFFYL